MTKEKFRFTVLTQKLIRLEYQPDGIFQDKNTQVVVNREFPCCEYRTIDKKDSIEIITDYLHVIYDKKPFSSQGLTIKLRDNLTVYHSIWHYGEAIGDMGGTARTLDNTEGEIPLDSGIISRNGYSVLDDSNSWTVYKDGTVTEPVEDHMDLYFFGEGRDYLQALKDYYKLTGFPPLLPRYALGNWWSRYYQYTQEEYTELMRTFERKGIPISVAVLDMDWHIVDIDPKYGSGWTGYTWNEKLFPDRKKFLKWLHKEKKKVTLNVHPAEGIRGCDAMYLEMARALGIDDELEDPIQFDFTDSMFVKTFFQYVNHVYEAEGVDFWWIDWQQGSQCTKKGLDPLWLLNHFYYLDHIRDEKRGLILSRYAGKGSHRYPIGFSGDTIMSWKTLAFQPYFTATASNIGYSWWSHDIGGHMLGTREEELAVRWLQFGVFSPIMRFHSSSSLFNSKEPWSYEEATEKIMTYYMRLRHRLLPYLYTMNARCHFDGCPLIEPMYYRNPESEEAYHVKNEYYFGSQLIVNPITERADQRLKLGKVTTWLPKGIYIDCMTGMIYQGNRCMNMYRRIEEIPVLAKAGAIIPMSYEQNAIELFIYAGNDGQFNLYEDNGETFAYENGEYTVTPMVFCYQKQQFIIKPTVGNWKEKVGKRNYRLHFVGFSNEIAGAYNQGKEGSEIELRYQEEKNEYVSEEIEVLSEEGMMVLLKGTLSLAENDAENRIFSLLNRAEIEVQQKEKIYDLIRKNPTAETLCELMALELDQNLIEAVSEIILAYN